MNPGATPADVAAVLAHVTAGLPGHEDRPGQLRMAELVAEAIQSKKHLIVQAGTGTGKTLAYLVGAIVIGEKLVVATATKALQDQLASKDLPFLDEQLGVPFAWAVLKGRNNYLCLQRLREVTASADGQLELGDTSAVTRAEITRLAEWAGRTASGDQSELDWSPSDTAWRSVSVGSDECPGAERCPQGGPCFAEAARRNAAAADVVVVNTHLYGLHVGSGGVILPPHDVVVFDEAHLLEDIMSDTVGVTVAPGRYVTLAATVRRILDDPTIVGPIAEIADALRDVLRDRVGERVPSPTPVQIREVLDDARTRVQRAAEALAGIDPATDDAKQQRLRAQQMVSRSIEQLDLARSHGDGYVEYVAGSADSPRLEIAPLDVAPVLTTGVWDNTVSVLTSATIPGSLAERVGLSRAGFDAADVGSPFDYASNSLLYCAMHLPDPRDAGFRAAVHAELAALIEAAGGRTLALFTSWSAMDAAADAVRAQVSQRILTQRDLPKPALVRSFADDESACLFATAGFFQGVDVPGRTLSLVAIDRIPFPRPDDPLLSARREQLGAAAFAQIDVPRAATLLAQAAGRLIRSASDRGVVAVFDRRLGTAPYRWDIVRALPPMRRTRERSEAESFLRRITG